MIRKTAIATVAVAALALGTASATSLGTFDDVAFAASDVDLLNCVLDTNAIALLPDLPALTDDPAAFLASTTARIGSIQVDLSSLPSTCLDDEVFTLILTSVDDVLATVELTASQIDAATVDTTVGTVTTSIMTIAAGDLTLDTTLGGLAPDVASITQVRMVLSDTL